MDVSNQWPSRGWQEAFAKEATPSTMQAVLRCAQIELERLRRQAAADSWDPGDLVQRVVVATCEGSLAWRPGVVPLGLHLKDAIRDLGRRLRRQSDRAMPEVALDALDDEDPVWQDAALSAASGEEVTIVRELAMRFERELWTLADGDQILLQVLRAMTDGEHSPTLIARDTGLPLAVVEGARRRLRRLAGCITPELLADIRSELSIAASNDGA